MKIMTYKPSDFEDADKTLTPGDTWKVLEIAKSHGKMIFDHNKWRVLRGHLSRIRDVDNEDIYYELKVVTEELGGDRQMIFTYNFIYRAR